MGTTGHERVFSASLGARERLITYAVGYGVGIGVPLALGVSFAIGFSQPALLFFSVPFAVAFGIPYFFRPTGYAITPAEIAILRPIGRKRISLDAICEVSSPARRPPGKSIGIARVEGFHGTFGSYWNRDWGRFQVFVTNSSNLVEVRLEDGSRVILSPDSPGAFVAALSETARERGIAIKTRCT